MDEWMDGEKEKGWCRAYGALRTSDEAEILEVGRGSRSTDYGLPINKLRVIGTYGVRSRKGNLQQLDLVNDQARQPPRDRYNGYVEIMAEAARKLLVPPP